MKTITTFVASCFLCAAASNCALAQTEKTKATKHPALAARPEVVEGVDGEMVLVRPPAAVSRMTESVASQTSRITDGAEIATFPWAANRVFTIAIRPAMFTTINFPRDEAIQQFAVSDPGAVNLSVNSATNVAMLKLARSQAVTATAVTSKRTYFLRVVPALDGPWACTGRSTTRPEEARSALLPPCQRGRTPPPVWVAPGR